jgi:acetylornithine deacetylase/succinyl-diaminopimelate desuccinylase-like protein
MNPSLIEFALPAEFLDDLLEFLRIPSVSTGQPDDDAIRRAARWLTEWWLPHADHVEIIEIDGRPLVVGEMTAQTMQPAPTVLLYGHFDVQGPGNIELWSTPPFAPVVQDGRVWARGAADDKGNLLAMCAAAAALRAEDRLTVNVRFVFEGDEESGESSAVRWLEQDTMGADCAVAMDSSMVGEDRPTITLSCRGMIKAEVTVRTAERAVHSGVYGGVTTNAIHVLTTMLQSVIPGPDGLLPEPLRAGAEPATAAEIAAWQTLAPAAEEIRQVGGRLPFHDTGVTFHELTGTRAALEVNTIFGGDTEDFRMAVPECATARLSVRTVQGQRSAEIARALEALLRAAAPDGVELEFAPTAVTDPAVFGTEDPAVQIAARAFEKVSGTPTMLVRQGGTLPIMNTFARKRIPAVISGFFLPDDAIHAPNESMSLHNLGLAIECTKRLLIDLAELRR